SNNFGGKLIFGQGTNLLILANQIS
uniref:Uncharacterized protein n=4 Tax=Cyprininae TaxID=2743694 RepID=A0A8C1S2Q9_CYPCA